MKEKIIEQLSKITNLSKDEIEKISEIPPSPELGDFAFPCFILAQQLKKSPTLIAIEIAKKISLGKEFEKIEARGPYVNVYFIRLIVVENTLKKILKEKEKYGQQKTQKEKTMIEFSQPNTHKAFHIGHVRGTAIGDSLSNILEHAGKKVVRVNYQGDTGMHVAKWLWCYQKFHAKEKLKKDEQWIASIYVEAIKKLSDNPEFQNEIDIINKKLENGSDVKIKNLWKDSRKTSLDVFADIYKKLGIKFNIYFFESQFETSSKKIVQELLKKNIAEVSEGATIVRLEKENLGVWVLLRKDGTVLYSAKDIALAKEKFGKYKIHNSIYVVGAAQKFHFMQLFKTLEMMNFKQAKNCRYVPVTEVRLPEGKMSSRTGENILFSAFFEEMVHSAKEEIAKREKLSSKESEKRAKAIALAALKYSMLKQDLNKPIIFDKQEALSFEGNTGPYLLYTYARAQSILKKSKNKHSKIKKFNPDEKEKTLALKLAQFPEKIISASESLEPNQIANYAYELAQLFNEWYHTHPVLHSENESFRRELVAASAQVLKNSLLLLGITALERM